MKKLLLSTLLLFGSMAVFGQFSIHRFEVNAGFGWQQYNGDMGQGFYKFNSCAYGVGSIGLNYSLTKSLDIAVLGTYGSYGYVPHTLEEKQIADFEHISAHMATGMLGLNYKFANGYLLPENARIAPSVYAGVGINHMIDFMRMECVVPGNYLSANFGGSLRFNFTSFLHASYDLRFGYFSKDVVDERVRGMNDMQMQNAVSIGVNL